MFDMCVAMTAMWNENYLDQELRNIHTKKIWCSKFKEKNMGCAHIPRNLAPAETKLMVSAEMSYTIYSKDRGFYAKMEMLK